MCLTCVELQREIRETEKSMDRLADGYRGKTDEFSNLYFRRGTLVHRYTLLGEKHFKEAQRVCCDLTRTDYW